MCAEADHMLDRGIHLIPTLVSQLGEIKLPQAGHFRSYRAITWPVLNELLRKQFDRYFNCKPCGSKHIGCGGRSA